MSEYFDRKGRATDFEGWARCRAGDRHVGNDTIDSQHISTVWVGLDMGFDEGPPLIFETMIFGGPHDQYCDRYSTEEAALAGHDQTVAALREGRDPQELR